MTMIKDEDEEDALPPGMSPLGAAAEIVRLRKNLHSLREELQVMVNALDLMRQEVSYLRQGLDRIYTWVQWGVGLVVSAVVLALLSLVLHSNGERSVTSHTVPSPAAVVSVP